MTILPVNGQKQASIGATWQPDVTRFPAPSMAVQLVQCEVTLALAGAITSDKLISSAAILPQIKVIFFFISGSCTFYLE